MDWRWRDAFRTFDSSKLHLFKHWQDMLLSVDINLKRAEFELCQRPETNYEKVEEKGMQDSSNGRCLLKQVEKQELDAQEFGFYGQIGLLDLK